LVLEHMKCSLEDIMKTRRYRSRVFLLLVVLHMSNKLLT